MKFLVFADLHLDATFAWAGREGAQRRRQAIRDTLDNIVDLASEVQADAVLCAGDLYEHERSGPDTGAFLRRAFERIERPVYIAPGNHDFYGAESLYAQVDWTENVTVFDSEEFTPVELTEGLRLWGMAHLKPAGTGDPFQSGFEARGEAIHLGLFHGSERASFELEVAGPTSDEKARREKAPHAPFDADDIRKAGLGHAFVGHYHRPKAGEWHTYPGNPQPLAFGEKGGGEGERGVVVAEVLGDGTVERGWREAAASPAHDIELDVSPAESFQDIRELVARELEGLAGVARLTLTGEVPTGVELDRESLERLQEIPHALDAPVVVRSDVRIAYDIEQLKQELTVRGRFVEDVLEADDFESEDERRRVLMTGLRALDGRDDLEINW